MVRAVQDDGAATAPGSRRRSESIHRCEGEYGSIARGRRAISDQRDPDFDSVQGWERSGAAVGSDAGGDD